MADGKADLKNSEETEDGIFSLQVPFEEEDKVKEAAKSCPVDSITVYDSNRKQIISDL